jgi:cation diffusion facilitator CzcD-associated flavoprotein CzcO
MGVRRSVVIIGSGFGGIGAAIELTRAGHSDVTILEKADDLGGVWRENTYPGAACDVPSPLYSYSYEPNLAWPRRYSGQADILAYLRRTAQKYGVDRLIRYGAEVSAATFDEARGRWRLDLVGGENVEADVLVCAVGQLSRPVLPTIPGRDSFAGRAFHSARWDHDYDLRGKRVAVIGTGASAVQFVPQIQPEVAGLTVFQRSAPYLGPKLDAAYSARHRFLRTRLPVTRLPGRATVWVFCEFLTRGMIGSRLVAKLLTTVCLAKLRHEVRDPTLRAKLTPDYPAGCKRVLFSNDYLPALGRPNVEVVTDAITAITPGGVLTAAGIEYECDAIIYGTGFAATDFLAPIQVRGVGGLELSTVWADGARAYLGLTVPGFPNLFLMYGPNTNLGAGSIVYMLECQARYVRDGVLALERAGAAAYLEVRAKVADDFDAELQRRLTGAVWSRCSNWYRTASGRVVNNWPGQVIEYRRRTRRFDIEDYRLTRG